MELTFDYETNKLPLGNPYGNKARQISYSYQCDDGDPIFHYHDEPGFTQGLRQSFDEARLIIGFNLKFDLGHAAKSGIRPKRGTRIWDCQLGEFILSGQTIRMPSLNGALERIGEKPKLDLLKEYYDNGLDTQDIPEDLLKEYNNHDVAQTYKLYKHQWAEMTPQQRRLCLVQGADLLVLQEMEENGLKYDVEQSKRKADELSKELDDILAELRSHSPTPDINFGSGQQLSIFLFGGTLSLDLVDRVEKQVYKSGAKKGLEYDKTYWKTEQYVFPRLFTPIPKSEYKLPYQAQVVYAAGEGELKKLQARTPLQKRIVSLLLRQAEADKLLTTYFKALPELMEEMGWDEYLHPNYNQCVARTGRLSSSKPNAQNLSGDVDKLIITRFNSDCQ